MSYSILASLKKKKPTDTLATIYIRGYYNSKPVAAISTGKKISMDDWDQTTRLMNPKAANASIINLLIQTRMQKMQNDLMKKEIMGGSINRAHISKVIKNVDDSKDFYQFCRDQIKLYKNSETRRTYKTEVSKLEQFKTCLSFADIDYNFLSKYRHYMQVKLANEPNTVWKSFKFMNTLIRQAVKIGGIIEHNPFKDFDRGKYVQTVRNFLEMEDCKKIEKFTTSENIMLRKVSIYFLLMAYSGMRFKDALRFDPALHIHNGERIVMKYEKWQTNVNIKLYDRLRNIVDLVPANRLNVSNKCFNENMKIIAGICGIAGKVTAHVGRHTMGGICAELEIPEEQAQQILGHKDIRSTRIYYHMKNKTIDMAMDKFNTI